MSERKRFVASGWGDLEREAADLELRGFDGLYHPTEPCGCYVTDLRPCGEFHTGCRGGQSVENGIAPQRKR